MMMIWLADALRTAGLTIVEEGPWKSRGRGPMSTVKGVILHHTAGPRADNPRAHENPSLNLVINGRPDLDGPLSHLYLGRDGTFHVLAAGRTNHAGAGSWHGGSGNSQFIGIEAENAGDGTDPWPPEQMIAYQKGVAALLMHLGLDSVNAAGHKEYATPKGRKVDPSFDMLHFREGLDEIMHGGAARVTAGAIPASVSPYRAMLRKGDRGDSVKRLQRILGIKADGQFGPDTRDATVLWQQAHGLTPDGMVGPKTWTELLKQEKAQ